MYWKFIVLAILILSLLGFSTYQQFANFDYYTTCYNCNDAPVNLNFIQIPLLVITIIWMFYTGYDFRGEGENE